MSRTRKLALAAGATTAVGAGFAWATPGLPQFGARPAGDRLARIEASPNFVGGKARNLVARPMGGFFEMSGAMTDYLRRGARRIPQVDLPVVHPDPKALRPQGDRLRVTWLGHSTLLIELDGHLLLTDPVFSERASPFTFAGPKRFHPPALSVAGLPPLDAVLISHDHWDHLDHQSILDLHERGVTFVVPLGVGAHLEAWGVPAERIREMDWWQELDLGDLRIASTPAHHFSGRGVFDRDTTLWTSYALGGPTHRMWYSGDTGPLDAAPEIRERYGPFDLVALEVGAHHPAWGTIHLGPDAAVDLYHQLGGGVLFPIHWGTFNLAMHDWDAPIKRLQERSAEGRVRLLAPLVGETAEPEDPTVAGFWRGRVS